MFSFYFPLGITKSLSNLSINTSTITFIDHSDAQGIKRNSILTFSKPSDSNGRAIWLVVNLAVTLAFCHSLVGCH